MGSPASQLSGSWKTTTSPRSGFEPNQGVSLSTRTRSPCWRVFCIESDGIENACTRNVLISSASTSAIPIRMGSSFQKERCFLGLGACSARAPFPGLVPLVRRRAVLGRPGVTPGGHGAVRGRDGRGDFFDGSSAVLLAVVSGPCANRHIPHANSLLCAAACPIRGAGPPLP